MKYKVIESAVEINGKLRLAGEVLDQSEFKPAFTDKNSDGVEVQSPSEYESLVATGHIVVTE